jgi:MraZ protein
MAFRGTYDHTLDAKNRLTVPAKFRPELAGGIVVASGLRHRCVEIWIPDQFAAHVEASVAGMHHASAQADAIQTFYNAHSFDSELDTAGRVMLPAKMLAQASLKKDVVVTGGGNHLKVWDSEAWAAKDEDLFAQALKALDQLSELPIA